MGDFSHFLSTLRDALAPERQEWRALQAENARLRAALRRAVADHRQPPLDGPHGWISYCRFCGQPTWDYDHAEDCPVRVFDESDS